MHRRWKYDCGKGEIIDAISAIKYMDLNFNLRVMGIIGYSFGAYIASLAYKRLIDKLSFCILVSPPNRIMNFDHIVDIQSNLLVILGDLDPYLDVDELRKLRVKNVMVVNGADHFWWGLEDKLADIVIKFLKENFM